MNPDGGPGNAAARSSAPAAPPVPGSGVCTVAIGAGAGGLQALQVLLSRLPAAAPPIVAVLHPGDESLEASAERLAAQSAMQVRVARDGETLRPGLALLAPVGQHLRVRREGTALHALVHPGPVVRGRGASIDQLFRSVAEHAPRRAVGILLSGHGRDGARGLLAMKQAGAATCAQDEASSLAHGKVRVAIRLAAVDATLPLHRLHEAVMACAARGPGR